MSNYNKATNFAVKDTLTSGDPDKIVSGAEIDNEFNAIGSAVTSKADKVAASTTDNLAALDANGNLKDSGVAGEATVPAGGIIMWSGLISAIPTGWALCDGNNTTPDLRDRFIIGAGSTYSRNDTGGSTTTSSNGGHTHTTTPAGEHSHGGATESHSLTKAEMPSHNHNVIVDRQTGGGVNTNIVGPGDGPPGNTNTGSIQNTGGNQPHNHGITQEPNHTHEISAEQDHNHDVTPPYLALAFIMKL